MKDRIEYIDIAKGIGILLVVIGHVVWGDNYPMDGSTTICRFIYSFHMPLFFIISGLCIKDTKRLSKDTVARMARGYLIPYAVWSVVYIVAFEIIAIIKHEPSIVNIDNYLFAHAISNCGVAPLWFLLALFISELITIALNQSVLQKCGGGYYYLLSQPFQLRVHSGLKLLTELVY